jgi:predicted ATPase
VSSLSNRPSSPTRTKFFGRTRELAAIEDAFAESPFVTLVGPPGIGKTRLASEWMRRQEARSGEPSVFVDLSVARATDDVLDAIAGALGCAPASVPSAIAERGGLTLVLDNAEGARDALAGTLGAIAETSDVRALVTSRIRIGVDGERVIALEGLAPDGDALALFVDRAHALRPDLQKDDRAVADLVQALEGVPLAIELAAARAVLLSPADLLERVRSSSLATLVKTVGTTDSMKARYEWSLALLAPAELAALVSLSTIASDFSAADAEAVTGSLETVEALREHHLLRATDDGSLVLYTGVRELVSDRADPQALARAFERWATRLARRANAALDDESDAANVELARLDRQTRPVLDVLVARACREPDDAERAAALFGALARWRRLRGSLSDVIALGEKLEAMTARVPRARVGVLTWLGPCVAEGNSARARQILDEAVALAKGAGDRKSELFARLHLCVILTRIGELAAARAAIDSLRDASDDAAFLSRLAHAAAGLAMREGDLERAYRDIEAAIVHAKRIPSSFSLSRAQILAGMICLERGKLDLATTHLRASLAACEAIGDVTTACIARNYFAEIRLYEGEVKESITLFQASALQASRIGLGVTGAYTLVCRGFAHLVSGHLSLADADFAEGRELLASFNQQGDIALAEAGRAAVAKLRGDDRLASFIAAAGEPISAAGVAALLSFADGRERPGPFTHPGPRIAAFTAARLREGHIHERAAPALTLLETGFVVEGQPEVSLVSRPRLLALMRALAEACSESGEAFVPRAKLVAETWPGERMLDTAAANRLKVALSTLRKLGMPLDSTSAGVRIAGGTAVRRDV